MNDWQTARQMAFLAKARAWSGGNRVLGDVIVSTLTPEELIGVVRDPFLIISVDSASPDPTRGDLWKQRFVLTVVQENSGDETGQSVLLGASRDDGLLASEGRGLLEIKAEVLGTLGFKSPTNGLPRFSLVHAGAAIPTLVQRTRYGMQKITVETQCTQAYTYAAPAQFQAVDATGGDCSLTWTLPPARFDRYAIVIRRAAGGTAPASETDGDPVTGFSALDTSHTDSPGAGEFSYAIFCGYDESNTYDGGSASSADRYSSQVKGTTRTVTVT